MHVCLTSKLIKQSLKLTCLWFFHWSVPQRTWKTFLSCSTMHKRQFFTPLHLFTTPRTSRWVIGNELSIYLFVLLYIQVLTNECLICVIMFFSCVISPSSNHCVLEPSAGYFTFLTRIMTASSVTWNSTAFRCPLKLHVIIWVKLF